MGRGEEGSANAVPPGANAALFVPDNGYHPDEITRMTSRRSSHR